MDDIELNLSLMRGAVERIKKNVQIFEEKVTEYEQLGTKISALNWKDTPKDNYVTFVNTDIKLLQRSVEFYKQSLVYLENAMATYEALDRKLATTIERGNS